MADTRTLSRTFPAVCLVLFPLLFLAGDLLFGNDPPDTAAGLDGLAADPGPLQLGYLSYLLGSVLAVWGMVAILHLLRGPGGLVGQVGAGLIMLGVVVSAAFYGIFPLFVTAATTPGLEQDQMVALFDGAEAAGGLVPTVLFVGFLLGLVGGPLVLAVGLWLRRAVPVWALIALAVSAVLPAVADGLLFYVTGTVLLLAAMAAVAYRILTLTDEQWAQASPLPERAPRVDA